MQLLSERIAVEPVDGDTVEDLLVASVGADTRRVQ